MAELSPQEINQLQGTRLSSENPWDSYDSEMGVRMSKELAAEVAEYALNRYEEAPIDSQTNEWLAESQENNEVVAKEYQWATPDEYQDVAARIGKVMNHAEFINTLRKAGISAWYTVHPHSDKLVLLVSKDGGPREVAAWVQFGYMPELSILNFDKYGAPLAERRRGYRTVLLQLILKGIITEKIADKYFGKPKLTAAFARYNSLIYEWRKTQI